MSALSRSVAESTGFPQALADELVALFTEFASEQRTQLTDALAARDRKPLRETAHALKGSALNIGLSNFAAMAALLEKGAMTQDWHELAISCDELMGSLDKILEETRMP
jgi:HPt (histidine-containing phosphotransfer) domain-containing protein